MPSSFRSELADAVVTLLQAATLGESVEVTRKWGVRRELADQCLQAVVMPGPVRRERENLAEVTRVYDVAVVVFGRVSTGRGQDDDSDRTDEIDSVAEEIAAAIEDSETVTVDTETVYLQETEVSEIDQDDWHQRRTYAAQVTAQYRRIGAS